MSGKRQSATASYAVVQGMYWMSFCIIFSFSSVYLLDRGFSNTGIGLLIGVSGTLSAILQPLVGEFADKSRKVSLRGLIMAVAGLMLLCAAGLILSPSSPLLTLLLYGILVVFLQVLTPLVYSLGMSCVNRGISLDFGLARGIGSLGFAGISYVAGLLVAAAGARIIPLLILALYGGLLAAVLRFGYGEQNHEAEARKEENGSSAKGKDLGFFTRYHRFFLVLAGGTLSFTSHNMINNFLFQIMTSKGGGSEAMGMAMALAAVCELPTMFFFGWMVKRVSSGTWLKISGLFFFLKSFATCLAPGITGMYLIQGLQMFGFALFVVASVYYVNEIMEERDRVKGQACMTMTNTLGGVLGSVLGGTLIDGFGIGVMLAAAAGAAAMGMGIMWMSVKRR